jgi:hypothetical protein
MDLEQRLRASLVAPDPGPMFTARVLARVGRGAARRRSSFIVIGAVLVVSAAAAMMGWRMLAVQPPQTESAAISAISDNKSLAEDPLASAMLEDSMPVAAALPASETEPTWMSQKSVAPGYSVLVMPLQQRAQDVAQRGQVEALHSAVLHELRKVPGLTLQLPGDSVQEARNAPDYVLTITSEGTRVVQSDSEAPGVAMRSVNGATTVPGDGPGSAVWVEISAESGHSAASRRALPVGAEGATPTLGTRTLTMVDSGRVVSASGQADGVDLNIIPSNLLQRMDAVTAGASASYGSGAMPGVTNLVLNNRLTGFNIDMDYDSAQASAGGSARVTSEQPAAPLKVLRLQLLAQDVAQQAAAQVEILRLQVFPPDAAFQQSVVARLSDARLDQAQARKLLQDLLQGLSSGGGSRLDAGTLRAVMRYAAGQAAVTRMYVWNALRQVSHPAMVAPLIDSLRHDADQQVRLAALANLEANYSADALVRTAFEHASREDPDEIVRVAVRRALYGQAQWRDEVLAALQNPALSYEARLAPILAGGPAVSPRQQGHRQAALREQQVLRPLIAVIRQHLQDSAHAEATSGALRALAAVDDPAVFDLFVQLIRETPALKQETTVRGGSISMSGPITSWVFKHRADPRVLESVSAVNPQLRAMMQQMGQNEDFAASAAP